MADGGFLVKVNGKELCRCYAVSFNYDEWYYTVNNGEHLPLPDLTENITVDIE